MSGVEQPVVADLLERVPVIGHVDVPGDDVLQRDPPAGSTRGLRNQSGSRPAIAIVHPSGDASSSA